MAQNLVYVRLTRYLDRCGIARDSKLVRGEWKYLVQCGTDGPDEWHREKDCEIIDEDAFDAYRYKD